MRKELVLEGLDCANCAAKIEQEVRDIEYVDSAYMNFITKTLTFEVDNGENIGMALNDIKKIVKSHEPMVVVRDKVIEKSDKRVLVLMGLSCANCAAKIETKVKNISGVKNANLDFVSKKMTIEINNKYEADRILNEAAVIVKQIEPEVNVVFETSGKERAQIVAGEGIASYKKTIYKLIAGAVLYVLAIVIKPVLPVQLLIFAVSYILIGGDVVLNALRNIIRGQVFDENFLMTVATIGAFSIRQFSEAIAVMLFYQIGELLQDLAVNRSRRSIAALMDIRPDFANIMIGDEIKRVSPEEVQIGDILIVKPGEKVPVDSVVVDGKSLIDTSALTGESLPREVECDNDILSGSINLNGVLTLKAKKVYGESTVSKILDLVQNAGSRKAVTENFITKFARYYTPVVVIIAAMLAVFPPLFIKDATFSQCIYKALSFLVVSCPCALVISIPLGFFGGIGGASKKGILIKGSNYLEALYNVDTIVFDKTGTLTKGVFNVTEIKPSNDTTSEQLLEYAAIGESYSNHPIALSIIKAYGKEPDKSIIDSYEEIGGYGTKTIIMGNEIIVGNSKLMDREGIKIASAESTGTIVHVASNKKYLGCIIISDEIKEDSISAVKELKNIGIKKTVMLTGDNRAVAEKIGRQLGMDEIYSELLPDQKVAKLEEIDSKKARGKKIMFVGDGINDAPVLARADVGTAMGGLGSDAAIEAADIVIMTDEPSKLVTSFKIARKTRKIVWENIIFALGVKIAVLILVALGFSTMWEAVFADVGVAVIAVLNAMRVMRN